MLNKLLYGLLAVLIIVVMFITTVDITSFNRDFYDEQYQKLEIAQTIEISTVDLSLVTEKLLDYIQNKTPNLDIEATIKGEPRQVFNEKEISHMVDVKNLYLNVINVRNLSFVGIVIIALCLFLKDSFSHFNAFIKSYYRVLTILGALVFAIGFMCWLDFDHIWRVFHQIFFSNDLWLLDPNTDVLIMMVPLDFFFSLVTKIALNFVLGVILFTVSLHLINKRSAD